jgi:hypothetical protein
MHDYQLVRLLTGTNGVPTFKRLVQMTAPLGKMYHKEVELRWWSTDSCSALQENIKVVSYVRDLV